ncbi:HdeD family acid-resistance protein [Methanolacinia paynteri]|uniref:HdeD family acid-resistance protein n=1 Tax=Methanolacinia paynteri TaxID=230356 RepID=UPI00064E9041|nr:DUF308 domain-containing protein [Methanolacinia paynteri]
MVDESGFLGNPINFTPEWWTFVLMGICALILGALGFAMPLWFAEFFGLFIAFLVIIYSIITLIQGIKSKEGAGASIALIILGIIGIIIGILIVTSALAAFLLTTYLIAFWMLMIAFSDIWMAFTGSAGTGYKILLVIAGIFALIIGFYLLMFPILGTGIMIQVISIFAMVWGIFMIITGMAGKGVSAAAAAEAS